MPTIDINTTTNNTGIDLSSSGIYQINCHNCYKWCLDLILTSTNATGAINFYASNVGFSDYLQNDPFLPVISVTNGFFAGNKKKEFINNTLLIGRYITITWSPSSISSGKLDIVGFLVRES